MRAEGWVQHQTDRLLTILLKESWHHLSKRSLRVCPQALGRLIGDLNTVLKHADREMFSRHGGEEEPEVVMDLSRIFLHVFDDIFEWNHPAGGQVTVLYIDRG